MSFPKASRRGKEPSSIQDTPNVLGSMASLGAGEKPQFGLKEYSTFMCGADEATCAIIVRRWYSGLGYESVSPRPQETPSHSNSSTQRKADPVTTQGFPAKGY